MNIDRAPGIGEFYSIFGLSGHGGEEGGDVTRQNHDAVVQVRVSDEDGAGGRHSHRVHLGAVEWEGEWEIHRLYVKQLHVHT